MKRLLQRVFYRQRQAKKHRTTGKIRLAFYLIFLVTCFAVVLAAIRT